MANYAQHVSTRETPQTERIPGEQGARQVQNSSGGFSFAVDHWTRLRRFLILGAEGSYYADERELTQQNAASLEACANEDFQRTLEMIVAVSDGGLAPKNDPAIFALAMLAARKPPQSTQALAQLQKVCRIGTHLFQFLEMVKQLRGRGRSLQSAVRRWYLDKQPRQVAYQITKYAQRNSWAHRDVLRLAKPKTDVSEMNGVFRYAVGKDWREMMPAGEARTLLEAVEAAKAATTEAEIVRLIRDHNLVREVIPNQWFDKPAVWEALLEKMPLTALVRNLGKMSNVGLIKPMSNGVRTICERLSDDKYIRDSRLHPMAILLALNTYKTGRGGKGDLVWSPDSNVIDALDGAFYKAFANVEPTGKRHLLALDISGSMGSPIAGTMLTARDAAAAMAMVTVKTEQLTHTVAFSAGGGQLGHGYRSTNGDQHGAMYPNGITPIDFSKAARLDHAVRSITNMPFGGTDCALPMLYALDRKIEVDAFVVLTDSETWAGGRVHPVQALRKYREQMNQRAKLIVVAMVANNFSIADPADAGMLDVVGMDVNVPAVMADFVRN